MNRTSPWPPQGTCCHCSGSASCSAARRAAASLGGIVEASDAAARRELRSLSGNGGHVYGATYSPYRRRLAAVGLINSLSETQPRGPSCIDNRDLQPGRPSSGLGWPREHRGNYLKVTTTTPVEPAIRASPPISLTRAVCISNPTLRHFVARSLQTTGAALLFR
jgi:hypothetical protein